MQSVSLLTSNRPAKNTVKTSARPTMTMPQDSLHFGQSAKPETPRRSPWMALALSAGALLTGAMAISQPARSQDSPPAVVKTQKLDYTNAASLRALAKDDNARKVAAFAERLGNIPDTALRKEITSLLLGYHQEEGLKLQQQHHEVYSALDAKDAQWESGKDVSVKAHEALDKLEKDGHCDTLYFQVMKAALLEADKQLEKQERELVELGDKATGIDVRLMDINTVTVNAIKYGLATLTDQPDYQAAEFRKLMNDPRGKVRLVATNYMAVLSNEALKAEFALQVADVVKNQKFYPPGAESDVPLNMIGSAAVFSAATIKDEALKLKTLTALSQQPLSSVKNAITAELAKVTGDYEKYKDMVIGASSSTIPGQFKVMTEVLSKWPEAVQKDLSVALSARGMNPKNDQLPDAYSRALGVVLLRNLPASEDAYKLTLLKQAALDVHTDPVHATTTVGYPFADKAKNKELHQYYLGLTQEAAPHRYIVQAYAVATARNFDYSQAELQKIMTNGANHDHFAVRLYTAASVEAVKDTAFQKTLLTGLVQDKNENVKQLAEHLLKELETRTQP